MGQVKAWAQSLAESMGEGNISPRVVKEGARLLEEMERTNLRALVNRFNRVPVRDGRILEDFILVYPRRFMDNGKEVLSPGIHLEVGTHVATFRAYCWAHFDRLSKAERERLLGLRKETKE